MKKSLPRPSILAARTALLLAIAALPTHAATGSWSVVTGSPASWGLDTNWTGSTIADGASSTANFTANITGNYTVNLDTPRTIGSVIIGDTDSKSAYTIATGANTLTFDNGASNAALTQNGNGTGDVVSGKLAIGGNGNLVISGSRGYAGFTVSAGITSALASGTQTLSINNGNTHTTTLSGVIGDGGTGGQIAVTKLGAGTVTVTNANTYGGGTTLNAGTLNVNHAQALGTGTFTISGGTFNNTTASAITLANNNAQAWNGDFTFGGTRALDMGTGAVTLGVSPTVTINGSGATALTVGGNISGAGKSLIKAGPGTLILSGTNTYDGGNVINGGVLRFNSAGAIAGTGNNVTVNYGGTAAFGYALDQATLTGRIVADGRGTVALAADTSNDLDFSAVGLSGLSLGAAGTTASTYSGALWTPADSVYRLGGGGGTLIFNPTLTGASNSLVVGGNGSGGTVTLVNAGTYSGGTTVSGAVGSGNAAIGTAGGAGLLQTNVLSGVSTTPFGFDAAITLNNGALGLGTAGTLAGGEAVNAAGYDISYNGQNAINLSAGGGSVTLAANTLTRVNNGVLLLNPTSGATLGSTEKVTVASGAPTVTNGMVAPHYINGTTRNFLTYGVNGFQDITYSVVGTTDASIASASATDTVVLSNSTFNTAIGGNKAIYALKLVNTSNQYNANAIGVSGETLTLLSGGLILDMTAGAGGGINFSSDQARATINFGTAEAVVGVFGSNAAVGTTPWLGTGGLTVYGTGSLQASNVAITGGITIAGATVRLGGSNGLNTNNQLTIDKAGTFQFIGSNSQQVLGLSGEGLVNNSSINTGTLIVDGLTGTGTTTFGGSIQNGSGSVAFTKSGANTQVLTGANSYGGTTTVSNGVLRLDYSAAGAPSSNIINNATNGSALALSGGKLDVVGAAGTTNSQQFNGLAVGAGNSTLAVSSGVSGTTNVTLGSTLTRSTGGTVDFVLPASGAVSTAATTTLTNGVLSSSGSNPTAFATVNGTDWATVSGGVVGAVSSYATGNANYTTTNNVDVTNGDAPASGVTVNSLRINSASTTLTLGGTNTINTGGILVTSAATDALITGGTLKSSAGNELVIITNGGLTVNSVLANGAAASALTLSGSGTTTLNGNNTFTGGAYINSGTVIAGHANALGSSGTINLNGGELQSSSALNIGRTVVLNKNFTIGGSNALTLSGTFTNNSSSSTLIVNNTGGTTLSGGVTLSATMNVAGSGDLAASGVISGGGGLIYGGTGTMTVSNTASTYGGVTKVTSGTLSVSTLAVGSANSSIGKSSNAASSLVVDGGTLKYTGATVSTDRLFSVGGAGGKIDASGTGALTFTNTGAIGFNNTPGARTLTLGGTNTAANTLGSVVGDYLGLYATSLAKSDSGKWVLTGLNTYTGGTAVNAGTLAYGNSFTMSGANSITLASTGIAGTNYATVSSTVGTLTFGGTLGIKVTASLSGSESFILFSADGGTLAGDFGATTGNVSISGTYAADLINDGFGVWTGTDTKGSGLNFTFSTTGGNAGILSVGAIPEPSTYAAILGAFAIVGAAIRRRRRV